MNDAREHVLDMLAHFVRGDDRSLAFVQDIESYLLENLRGTALFRRITVPIASYRPEGGEYLYDEEALKREFIEVLSEEGHTY